MAIIIEYFLITTFLFLFLYILTYLFITIFPLWIRKMIEQTSQEHDYVFGVVPYNVINHALKKYIEMDDSRRKKRWEKNLINSYIPLLYFMWDKKRYLSICIKYNLFISLWAGSIYSLFIVPEIFRPIDPPPTPFWVGLFISLIILFSVPFIVVSYYSYTLRQHKLDQEFEETILKKRLDGSLSDIELFLINLKNYNS